MASGHIFAGIVCLVVTTAQIILLSLRLTCVFKNKVPFIWEKSSVTFPLNVLLFLFNKEMKATDHQGEQIKIAINAVNNKSEQAKTKL